VWNPCISEPTSCPVKLFCAIITAYDKFFSSVLTTNTTNFITYDNINRNNKFSTNYTTKKTAVIDTKTVTVNRKGKIKMKNQKGSEKKKKR
jgi:Tfp pilus assembly protein FimT